MFNVKIFDKKFSLSNSNLIIFFDTEIFWFWFFHPYTIAGTIPLDLRVLTYPLVFVLLMLASIEFIKTKVFITCYL